jgi:hypothetical protein
MVTQTTHYLNQVYQGFEQGPIRPPSEAGSLLLRVTRNCPWNKCKFCPVYKGARFSLRPVEHVLLDLEAVYRAVQEIQGGARLPDAAGDPAAWQAARHWQQHGGRQVFLQDADSLVIKPAHLLAILRRLQELFPGVQRVTSYARSRTLARMAVSDLTAMRQAGLNRLHVGLESGADEVLELMRKGVTRVQQISAGQKVKQAGIELSLYYMPGLGGRDLWEANARETAAALKEIQPDFIRLRTLAIPLHTPLYEDYQAGRFAKPTDVQMARELLLFLESLEGVHGVIRSDHILNLLPEVEGTLPQDRERLIEVVRAFLDLDPELQLLYRVGRRTGWLAGLGDLDNPARLDRVRELCRRHQITPANLEQVIDEMMRRFI